MFENRSQIQPQWVTQRARRFRRSKMPLIKAAIRLRSTLLALASRLAVPSPRRTHRSCGWRPPRCGCASCRTASRQSRALGPLIFKNACSQNKAVDLWNAEGGTVNQEVARLRQCSRRGLPPPRVPQVPAAACRRARMCCSECAQRPELADAVRAVVEPAPGGSAFLRQGMHVHTAAHPRRRRAPPSSACCAL